jgi:hypothetical protein
MGVMVSVTPWPRFTPGERTPVPIGLEAGWTSELVWTQKLEEKCLPLHSCYASYYIEEAFQFYEIVITILPYNREIYIP